MAEQFTISGTLNSNPIRQLGDAKNFSGSKPRLTNLTSKIVRKLPLIVKKVKNSWNSKFLFKEEIRGIHPQSGLRSPQIGGLHAALAHWKVTNSASTVVMPTGTGKTETMIALTVCQKLERVLLVVPTDALREQITNKFLTLGLLKEIGVIRKSALYPIVGTLEKRPRTVEEVKKFFDSCNVVVTTMSVVSGCSEEIQSAMSESCSHLFIDEAHHISAPTWQKFRRRFAKKTILQFTATPFRGDGRHVDGKVIFNYPLRKAQEEEYFKPINFLAVREYNRQRADESIAKKALEQLRKDLGKNLNHILMARADNIKRAEAIYELYKQFGPEFSPLLIHSKKKVSEKKAALKQLRDGNSRILVCVDMFGEGFDMPELKIAALHDIHKSLAITLQFTGRFTRSKTDIGDASMVANIVNPEVEDALKELYAEDADWNKLLRTRSEGATRRQEERSQFLEGFSDLPPDFLLQNVLPKMSTVVYKTNCVRWKPEKITDVIKESKLYVDPTVNQSHKVALFVTCEREPISWGNIKELHNTVWDLYLIHWDEEQKLLFINSSNNKSLHADLAKAVAGEDVQLISGEAVFRSLSGINRIVLMNLGLTHSMNRAMRFTMYVGVDILQALTDAQQQNRIKSNLFGRGFEKGGRSSIGCSYKGRIWSYRIADDIAEWIEWCHGVGKKITDETISVSEILKYVLRPTPISARPEIVPLTIEWSEDFLQHSEEIVQINIGGDTVPLYEAGIELVSHAKTGPIKFRVFTENKSAEYEIKFRQNDLEYAAIGSETAEIIISRKRATLSEWFQADPPIIRFENESYLHYNYLVMNPIEQRTPMDKEKIETWDWTGTNIREESQTLSKSSTAIQYKVLQTLKASGNEPDYDIIFNDDGSYEAADVIGIKIAGDNLIVDLFHCKFSQEVTPGARIEDLYAVCGQAQKSVQWRDNIQRLFEHIFLRETSTIEKRSVSRFEKGSLDKLEEIRSQAPFLNPQFKIGIVQPGLSKTQVTTPQLELLAVTENYLKETHAIELRIIASS